MSIKQELGGGSGHAHEQCEVPRAIGVFWSRPTIREIRMLIIRKSKGDVIDYYAPRNLT
jgi:hypothetical protein